MSTLFIVPRWHFSTSQTGVFCVLFFLSCKKIPGYNTQSRGTGRTPLWQAASVKCLIFDASLTLDTTNLGSNPRKPYSQIYAPPYCLLSNGFQFFHIEVFNRDRKLVSVSAIPSYSYILRCLLLRTELW